MKNWKALSFLAAVSLVVAALPVADAQTVAPDLAQDPFVDYVHGYSATQFFSDNDTAFDARLKLLDKAGKGARVEIATFEFNNGKVVRLLAHHICLAQMRGAQVELLVDSKSGDRPGLKDPFDKSEDSQVVEDLFQYMANCGVKVYIHNHLESYIEVMGQRLPNLFLDKAVNGKTYWGLELLSVSSRLNHILDKVTQLAQPQVTRAGGGDVGNLVTNLKNAALEFLTLRGITATATADGTEPQGFTNSVASLKKYYLALIGDPVWQQVSARKLSQAVPQIAQGILRDPEMGALRREFHRFNRLNHRKLFLVESGDGKEGCMILGGRNLGDEYLVTGPHSYLDGDLLLCRHQSAEASAMLNAANASFNELKTDLSDRLLGLSHDNSVRLVPANPKFAYANLAFMKGATPRNIFITAYQGHLSGEKRVLLPVRKWSDSHVIKGDFELRDAADWRFLKASWDPAHDEIAQTLLQAVRRERKEIYIETAYAEFSAPLRAALAEALERGVKVRLVSNSLLTSDGFSGLIRILMNEWISTMKARHGTRFALGFTTLAQGHMVHFKGAGFACQDLGETQVRSYIVGSHNFHPRSGRDDKEHALFWSEPVRTGCSSGFDEVEDLVKSRTAFYARLAQRAGSALQTNPDLAKEILQAGRVDSRKTLPSDRWFALAMKQVFFEASGGSPKLEESDRVSHILELLEDGGLHDLFGLIL